MTARSRSTNAPLWIIVGLVAAGVVTWLVMMTMMMFAWGGWGWGWGGMRGMHDRGSNTSGSSVVVGGMDEQVDMRGFAFSPGNLQVPVGATVTWTNADSAPHNAVDRGGGWSTDILDRGDSGSITFEEPGDYDYFCSIHPSMRARLVVR